MINIAKKFINKTFQDREENIYFYSFMIALSIVVWIVSMLPLIMPFVKGETILQGDANPYFEHFKFYIDQISRGVYPLWDPSRDHGQPTELFLRRIGSFNPLYWFIVIFYKLDVPFRLCYFSFLIFYYFLGMIGFFLLAKRIFNNHLSAFTAFLLLSFSCMSCIIITSFVILEFTPMVWLLYFLFAFYKQPEKKHSLGGVFCLMVLLQTYLPFYFIFIVMVITVLSIIFYFQTFKSFILTLWSFSIKTPYFTILCLSLILLSSIPGILLFQDASQKLFVLPVRQQGTLSTDENAIAVARQTTETGGVVITNFLNESLFNLKDLRVGQLYLPIFAFITFSFCLFIKLNKRLIFLSLLVLFFYLVGLYDASPIYNLLYKYIFFFKYIRNFQFFLWLVIIPSAILICTELMQEGLKEIRKTKIYCCISFIHLVLLGILFQFKNPFLTLYFALLISFLFFTEYRLPKISKQMLAFILFLAVILPSIAVHKNFAKEKNTGFYRYEPPLYPYLKIQWPEIHTRYSTDSHLYAPYLATYGYDQFIKNIDLRKLALFSAYDNIEIIDENSIPWDKIDNVITENKNVALISHGGNPPIENIFSGIYNLDESPVLTPSSQEIEILAFDANYIKFKTAFSRKKFLIYFDNFYPGWHAFINQKEVPIYRSFISFKGIGVPGGENIIKLEFGNKSRYFQNYFLLCIFWATFIALLYLYFLDRDKHAPVN